MRVVTLVIFGAGETAAATARQVAAADLVSRVVLVDEAATIAEGKALDISQAAAVDRYDTRLAGSADEAAAVSASIIVVADRAGERGEWSDEAGLALLQRLNRLNARAPILCAGVRQRSLIDRGVHELGLPRSACHRLLAELGRCGYVRQLREQGDYVLTTKMPALGLNFLGGAGIVDIAQPIIDRLAEVSGELVRLALVDGDSLIFVAKAQGACTGLRYDPDMGIDVRLSCSAAGHAWLMTLPEDQAIAYVTEQGLGKPRDFGPNAPTSIRALLASLDTHRRRGYSILQDVYAAGMSAMAAPVA